MLDQAKAALLASYYNIERRLPPNERTPLIDFQGMSRNHPIASVGFYGLPMLSAALRQNNRAGLRQIINTLIA